MIASCSAPGHVSSQLSGCEPDTIMESCDRGCALPHMHRKMNESPSLSTIAPEDIEFQDFHEDDDRSLRDLLSEIEVVEAFKVFDGNGDGFMCLPDMRRVLQAAGFEFADYEFDDATGGLTVNAEGQISILHFAEAFLESDLEAPPALSDSPRESIRHASSDDGCFSGAKLVLHSFFFRA